MKTFKDTLDAHRGVGPGFDLLRILLAVAIFYGHAKWAANGGGDGASVDAARITGQAVEGARTLAERGWEGWRRPILVSYVPAFFALSGFLVTGSALRTQVVSTFLAFRALRIFPALVVEVTLSAILLGFFATRLTPAQYFTDPDTFRYLGNMVGWVTFFLPGVFETNPVHEIVNINLWTLPSEFDCYLITALLMLTGIFYRRTAITVLFLIVTAAFAVLNLSTGFAVTETTAHPITVTYYFFVGVMFYHWREKIPQSWPLFLAAGAAGYALQMGHHAAFLAPVFVTYCTMFFGMQAIPKIKLIASGDYSYGIYLYGFPITQALVFFVPALRGNGWGVFLIAATLTCLFAAFSWHVIEKRALALKNRLPLKYFPKQRPAPTTPAQRAEA